MRVDPRFTAAPTAAAQPQRRPAATERFSPASTAGGAKSTSGPTSAAPLATLDALLALQGEDDPAERRRRSLRRGHDLLDALDRLKAGLLAGRLSPAELQGLVARLADRPETSGDAGLDEVLAHIELRARVEIAKLSA